MSNMTAHELAERAGVSYRQVNHWTSKGYLTPSERSNGSGYPNLYGYESVRVCYLLSVLLTPGNASKIALTLAENGRAQIGNGLTLELGH